MLHWYEDGSRWVNAWNAVDVVGDDGLLQRGHVIDLQESDGHARRLLVDFGCPGQESVLVDYGKVFNGFRTAHDWVTAWEKEGDRSSCFEYGLRRWGTEGDHNSCFAYELRSSEAEIPTAEVLLRAHYDQPWKWYPANVVIFQVAGLAQYALVEVMLGGRAVRELLPYVQIRQPPSAEELRCQALQPGHFIFPRNWGDEFYWKWSAPKSNLFQCRGTERQHLQCRLIDLPSPYSQRRRVLPALYQNMKTTNFRPEIPDTNGLDDFDTSILTTRERGLILPVILLVEVFQSLEVLDRLRCRRTCWLWDDILASPKVVQQLCVTLPDCVGSSLRQQTDYRIASRQELSEKTTHCTPAGDTIHFIEQVLRHAGVRVDRLVLCRYSLSQALGFRENYAVPLLNDLEPQHSTLKLCCGRIVWKNYHPRFAKEILLQLPDAALCLNDINQALL
ncbi:uncharacterized protein LOC129582244 isoform X2 [Paramacrobiotus metropolitanus]|uniref:uncharacterized protein LOC129582244 isoform X2 n=1 Tax=Paramacrobiotus metropolitanus TaxID=2943436 RepID=UPI0024463CD0|nr:uncharacterized protein LOC129582244 isoform X2 [Paramacrobiotus metropolitanus]